MASAFEKRAAIEKKLIRKLCKRYNLIQTKRYIRREIGGYTKAVTKDHLFSPWAIKLVWEALIDAELKREAVRG